MSFRLESSKQRYRRYRNDFDNKNITGATELGPSAEATIGQPGRSHRSFFDLLRAFFELMRGQRGRIVAALGTLTIATMLNLVPPAATKIVVDYVLLDNPIPAFLTERLGLPSDRKQLLVATALGIVAIAVVSLSVPRYVKY